MGSYMGKLPELKPMDFKHGGGLGGEIRQVDKETT